MTEPAGVTLEMRVPVTPCRARAYPPGPCRRPQKRLAARGLKPTFTGFRVVARLGSLPQASCATANHASRPRRRLKPPVDLAEALRRAAYQGAPRPPPPVAFCPDLPVMPVLAAICLKRVGLSVWLGVEGGLDGPRMAPSGGS